MRTSKNRPRQAKGSANWIYLLIIAFFYLMLSWVYLSQPEWSAAILLVPGWMWLFPGLIAASWFMFTPLANRKRARAQCFASLLLFTVVAVPEPASLVLGWGRQAYSMVKAPPLSVEIVSINCAGGSQDAARYALLRSPEILLLQESPGQEHLARLAREFAGDDKAIAWGLDASVIAKGKPVGDPLTGKFYTALKVETPSMGEVWAVSVRLLTPSIDVMFPNPQSFKVQRENREIRREQMRELAELVRKLKQDGVPVIVGGDFNTPAYDRILRDNLEGMYDAFVRTGRGHGNTIETETPLHRIDMIWLSSDLKAAKTVAVVNPHSDHRMVAVRVAAIQGE